MRMGRIVVSIVFMTGMFIATHVAKDSSSPDTRFGPGNSKFVSVSSEKAADDNSGWSFPSMTQVAIYAAYLMGGSDHLPEEGPKAMHDKMAKQVEQSLRAAEDAGIATGPTVFDAHINRGPAPATGLPKANPHYGK